MSLLEFCDYRGVGEFYETSVIASVQKSAFNFMIMSDSNSITAVEVRALKQLPHASFTILGLTANSIVNFISHAISLLYIMHVNYKCNFMIHALRTHI